jgi:hypothetical protein
VSAALESLIVVIAAAAAAVPWLTSKLSGRVIGAAFGVLLALLATAAALALDLYPWSIVLVIGVALAGGVGLGRLMPARFLAWLLLLVALSILDIAQVALTSGSPTPGPGSAHGPVLGQYLNLRLLLPWGRASIGIFDLLLVTGIGELWRRTGAPPWSASSTALVGVIAADIFAALSGMRGLALTPFITLGWLVVAGTGQLRKRRTLPRRR